MISVGFSAKSITNLIAKKKHKKHNYNCKQCDEGILSPLSASGRVAFLELGLLTDLFPLCDTKESGLITRFRMSGVDHTMKISYE